MKIFCPKCTATLWEENPGRFQIVMAFALGLICGLLVATSIFDYKQTKAKETQEQLAPDLIFKYTPGGK